MTVRLPRKASRAGAHRQTWLRVAFVPFLVSRALLFALGLAAVSKFSLCPFTTPLDPSGLPAALRIWARWDTGWYLQIARSGYTFRSERASNVAFFPLYPMLLRAGGWVFGQNTRGWLIAGLLISHVAFIVSLVLLYRLSTGELGNAGAARRACVYLCVFPSTLFLGAVYPMSLGLALTLGAYAAALGEGRSRWWLAGLLGGLAALTRAEGVLLLVPLAAEFITARRLSVGDPASRPRLLDSLGLALIPLAFAGWCLFLYCRFGDPMAFRTTLGSWSRGVPRADGGQARFVLDWVVLGFFIALLPICWRRLRPSYALHATIYVFMLLMLGVTGTVSFGSGMRYGLNLSPEFLVLGLLGRHTSFHDTFLIISTGFASMFMIAFALFYWVA